MSIRLESLATRSSFKLTITPNPYLSEKQQCIVADDYALENKLLEITTRQALAHYYLRRMGTTQNEELLKNQPEVHQLTAYFDKNSC